MSDKLTLLKESIPMIIDNNHPRLEYRRRGWEQKKTIRHWGQRKLLLSEILFLTRWGHLSNTVVYAGAAPGTHISYLTYLFPNHNFILIDPNPFQIISENLGKIQIINAYFDDNMANSFLNQDVLFVSDIRTADYRQMTKEENERYIVKDNEIQMKWIRDMKPAKSMLKFRCPYPDIIAGQTQMFKGTLFFQAWAPGSSTETRLVVDDSLEIINYDNLVYEEYLSHHNVITRYKLFNQPVKGEGLDQSYDAAL